MLVLANLKARNLGGFKSHGMVLCASNDDHTQVRADGMHAHPRLGRQKLPQDSTSVLLRSFARPVLKAQENDRPRTWVGLMASELLY